MNIEFLNEKVEKLESVFTNILYLKPEERVVAPNISNLDDLRVILNSIFDDNKCLDVLYTQNTDKQFFGIKINPSINSSDSVIILSTDEKVKLINYQIEFDSKLFEIGLTSEELAAITIYEVSSMMDSTVLFDNLRALIDYNIISNDDILSIRDSVNYANLIIFAIKDTMYKLSSFIFKDNPEDLLLNPAVDATNSAESLLSAREKVIASISGLGDSFRSPKPVILEWMFLMCRDMQNNSGIIIDTMKDARLFTGSKLEIIEINKVLDSITRINYVVAERTDLNKFFDQNHLSSLNELSLFKSLKKNGLRGIENELYEFSLRVKNCTESDDAYLIMRGINSRLGLLEDYLYSENLSDHDRKHWEDVAQAYRDLRIILSKKKLDSKQYGLFYDYSKLDQLDNN